MVGRECWRYSHVIPSRRCVVLSSAAARDDQLAGARSGAFERVAGVVLPEALSQLRRPGRRRPRRITGWCPSQAGCGSWRGRAGATGPPVPADQRVDLGKRGSTPDSGMTRDQVRDGVLLVGDDGCGYYRTLVVTGEHRGQVWRWRSAGGRWWCRGPGRSRRLCPGR